MPTILFQRRGALGRVRSEGLERELLNGCAAPTARLPDVVGQAPRVEVARDFGDDEAALGLVQAPVEVWHRVAGGQVGGVEVRLRDDEVVGGRTGAQEVLRGTQHLAARL